jgi:trans-aconitate 2-methyltransferase
MPDAWSPSQYERFRAERAQTFWDLAALVEPRPGVRIADLGCGTGDLPALVPVLERALATAT